MFKVIILIVAFGISIMRTIEEHNISKESILPPIEVESQN